MKFSFILPVYNAEKTLEACINSILNQSYCDLELICIDDCSSDGSIKIVRQFQEKDDRVQLICNDKNIGTLCSRKKGVLQACGDYILFADNDDAYELDACQILFEEINTDPTDILMYKVGLLDIGEHSSLAQRIETERLLSPIAEKYVGDNCIVIKNRISLLWNKAVKTEICKEAYQHAEDLFLTITEDRYASYLIHYYANSFRTIENILYRWNSSTGTSTKKSRTLEQYDNLCRCMWESSRAIEKFLRESGNQMLVDYYLNTGNNIGYCIDEWYKSIETDMCAEALEILMKYYDKDSIMKLLHSKMNQSKNGYDKYCSFYLKLCKSRVFRIYYFLCRKFLKRFNNECL